MPGYLIRRLHQNSQAVFDAQMAAAGFDLTPLQYAALRVVADHPGLDQASLASIIAFDRATVGGVVDRLEAKGLLRREIRRTDRRARYLHVEPAGLARLDAVTPLVRGVQDKTLAALDANERATLVALISKALKLEA